MKLRIATSLTTALVLVVLLFLAVGAQVKQPAEWIIAKRLTVATQADIGTALTAATVNATTLTAANAVFTNLTAPTVTMTSATTWTVASLTATNLAATDGTITTLGATTGTVTTLAATTGAITTLTAGAATVNGNATVTGTLEVEDLTVNGNVDVTGNVEVVDHLLTQAELYLIPPETQTVIDGGTITGTGGIVEVTAAGEVTATLVTAGDGQVLILVNVGAQTINIADAGTTKLAGALALGADDTVMLIGAGVTWYEVNRSAN